MFKHEGSSLQSRVLIASADAEARRHMGEIVKAAELRAVGFIREVDQIELRTRVSMPDVLLLDVPLFCEAQARHMEFAQPHTCRSFKVVLWEDHSNAHANPRCKRDGVSGVLNVGGMHGKDSGGLAGLLRKAVGSEEAGVKPPVQPPAPATVASGIRRRTLTPGVVVIGSSTGGPVALMTLLKGLPADFPLPIAVVQHMPPGFTRMLAERLHAECALRVVEGEAGMEVRPGTVYIAPGGMHMVLCGNAKAPRIDLNLQDPENSCRPAVDVLFRSSTAVYGGGQHAIVLTGMGRDGLAGATQLYSLGSRIVVQDAATSTVWGMPGAIAQAGFADDILPIDQIAPQLLRCLS